MRESYAEREERKRQRDIRKKCRDELKILRYMKKTDVLYHHHGYHESLKKQIQLRIDKIKETNVHYNYDPYGWNWGVRHPGLSLLGCVWRSSEFENIYEVPLDGSYIFQVYDSGERGLGSKNRITAIKAEIEFKAPQVNPGGIIPITAW